MTPRIEWLAVAIWRGFGMDAGRAEAARPVECHADVEASCSASVEISRRSARGVSIVAIASGRVRVMAIQPRQRVSREGWQAESDDPWHSLTRSDERTSV